MTLVRKFSRNTKMIDITETQTEKPTITKNVCNLKLFFTNMSLIYQNVDRFK